MTFYIRRSICPEAQACDNSLSKYVKMHILTKILEEMELEACTIGIWGHGKAEEAIVLRRPCDVLAEFMKHF